MRDAASKIGLTRCDDIVIAAIHDPGREHHIAHVHLMLERTREFGVGFEKWVMLGTQDDARIIRIQQ